MLNVQDLKSIEKLHIRPYHPIPITGIGHLKYLRTLNIASDGNVENLDTLTFPEKLSIEGGEVINKLPKLREVNVCANELKKEAIELQLDKPEIVVWFGLPHSHFRIRIDS